MKAPDPPPALIVRNAVQMLKVSRSIDLDGIVFVSMFVVWQYILLSFMFTVVLFLFLFVWMDVLISKEKNA